MKNFISSSIVSDETIDQLVDGQLTGDRYREVLRSLDQSRDGWRRCAIAFLQEQALSQELRSLSQSGFHVQTDLPCVETSQNASSNSVRLAHDSHAKSHKSMWKAAGKLNLLSLAASMLFAFAVGWFGAGMREVSSVSNRASSHAGMGNVASMSNPSRLTDESIQPSLNPTNFDPARLVVGAHKSFVPLDRQIPEQLLELERRGIVQIETIDGILPFELEDGSAAVIPVQNFRVRPIGYAY